MNSEPESNADDLRNHDYSGVGCMLRRAREERGLSLEEIAVQTRIPLRQLGVIERGAFATLPSRTYAIGFSRTYARALGLDDAAIADAVRAELGASGDERTPPPSGMEPGDPAKLPSKGLAWAGAVAALVLALGLFAWFSSYFAAGRGAAPLVVEAEGASPAITRAPPTDDRTPAAGAGGTVTFTAREDGIWVRLYQEGGERLFEKTLTKGESFTVPADAPDPRLNTGRPDALDVAIDGKPAARLADRAVSLGGEPVSAAALLARASGATPAPVSDAAPAGTGAVRRDRPRQPTPRASVAASPETTPTTATGAPAVPPPPAAAPSAATSPAAAANRSE